MEFTDLQSIVTRIIWKQAW